MKFHFAVTSDGKNIVCDNGHGGVTIIAKIKELRSCKHLVRYSQFAEETESLCDNFIGNTLGTKNAICYSVSSTGIEVFPAGTQIAFIPTHATGIRHPDVEFGFVTKDDGKDYIYCKYWRKGKPGILRTVSNSELTPRDCIVEYKSVDQCVVDILI